MEFGERGGEVVLRPSFSKSGEKADVECSLNIETVKKRLKICVSFNMEGR